MQPRVKKESEQETPIIKSVTVKWSGDNPAEMFSNVLRVQSMEHGLLLDMTDGSTVILSNTALKWVRIENVQYDNSTFNNDETEERGNENEQ